MRARRIYLKERFI